MAGFAMLISADHAALEDREESFKRVGVHIAARPLEFRVIDRLMLTHLGLVVLRAIGHKAAIVVKQLRCQSVAYIPSVQVHRAQCAAALNEAQDLLVWLG